MSWRVCKLLGTITLSATRQFAALPPYCVADGGSAADSKKKIWNRALDLKVKRKDCFIVLSARYERDSFSQ